MIVAKYVFYLLPTKSGSTYINNTMISGIDKGDVDLLKLVEVLGYVKSTFAGVWFILSTLHLSLIYPS